MLDRYNNTIKILVEKIGIEHMNTTSSESLIKKLLSSDVADDYNLGEKLLSKHHEDEFFKKF